ncbi:7TM-DISM domain-containing protein [Leptospira sp. 96542]|nr:7TM-DISM domain-containing protein [Leptospira sp. 96542]
MKTFVLKSKLFFIIIFMLGCNPQETISLSQNNVLSLISEQNLLLNVSNSVLIYEDSTSSSLEEIQKIKDRFTPNQSSIIDKGFSNHTIWIYIDIQNHTDNSRWYIALKNNRLDYVDFYFQKGSELYHETAGDRIPLGETKQLSFPYQLIELPKSERAELWIRIRSDAHISFPIWMMSAETFGNVVQVSNIRSLALIFTILLYIVAQILFNKYLSNRVKIYLVTAHLIGIGYPLFLYEGGFHLILRNYPTIQNYIPFVCVLLFGVFFTLFFREFFYFQEFSNWLHNLGGFLAFVFCIQLVFLFLPIPNKTNAEIRSISFVIMYALLIYGVYLNVRKKRYWALMILSPWGILCAFTVWELFVNFHLVRYRLSSQDLILLAYSIEFVFIFVSSYYQFRSHQKERNEFLEKLDGLKLEIQNIQSLNRGTSDSVDTENSQSLLYQKRLGALDQHAKAKEIVQLFETKEPFLRDGYSLSDLANELGIRSDQASAILSNELKTNFYSFVNEYRVHFACKRIEESKEDPNLLDIAFESGFGSRSAFNRAFHNVLSISPNEFKKSQSSFASS